MLSFIQDVVNEHQNWTLVGILGSVLVAVIGLLVWIVKWLATELSGSRNAFSGALKESHQVVGESTQTLTRVVDKLETLHDGLNNLPVRTADELQRRHLSS